MLEDPSTPIIPEKYVAYENRVRAVYLYNTAAFLLNVIEHTRMLQYFVKTNNLILCHKCNGATADHFFAYDGPSYSR